MLLKVKQFFFFLFKEKDRKLEQLLNKRRKEEFYKQWLELEPVAEVDDENEPLEESRQQQQQQQQQSKGVTREAYQGALMEMEELQMRLAEERGELTRAKSQVRDLEKALLQEVSLLYQLHTHTHFGPLNFSFTCGFCATTHNAPVCVCVCVYTNEEKLLSCGQSSFM